MSVRVDTTNSLTNKRHALPALCFGVADMRRANATGAPVDMDIGFFDETKKAIEDYLATGDATLDEPHWKNFIETISKYLKLDTVIKPAEFEELLTFYHGYILECQYSCREIARIQEPAHRLLLNMINHGSFGLSKIFEETLGREGACSSSFAHYKHFAMKQIKKNKRRRGKRNGK